jgi:thiol-disulfide isomerase/thioredoxin
MIKGAFSKIMQSKALKTIKPVATAIVIVLILKWTGALSGISYLTSSAILQTGVMDASVNSSADLKDKPFDYNFLVYDLQGKPVDFQSFKGKTIFLNLWATWCGPCRVEMPSIQELYNKVDTSKVVFVMLSLDVEENKDKITRFVADKKYTFPVYRAGDYLPEPIQVTTIPTTFVVSADGMIVSKKVGAANYDTTKFLKFLNGEK